MGGVEMSVGLVCDPSSTWKRGARLAGSGGMGISSRVSTSR